MKTSNTFKLFVISISLIILTFILVPFLGSFYASEFILGIIITVALGVGLWGFIIGIIDFKRNSNSKYWIGFIGNTLVLALFFLLLIYILLNLPDY